MIAPCCQYPGAVAKVYYSTSLDCDAQLIHAYRIAQLLTVGSTSQLQLACHTARGKSTIKQTYGNPESLLIQEQGERTLQFCRKFHRSLTPILAEPTDKFWHHS